MSRGGSIVFIRKEKLPNLTDKSKPPVVVGVLDGNRSWEQLITFGKETLDWNVKFVVGYPGTSFLLLAVRRGETHMMGTSNLSLLKEMFDTGGFVGVSQLGGGDTGANDEARTNFENIPTFPMMMKGKVRGLESARPSNSGPRSTRSTSGMRCRPERRRRSSIPIATPGPRSSRIRNSSAWASCSSARTSSPSPASYSRRSSRRRPIRRRRSPHYMDDMKLKNGLPAEALTDEELAAMAKAKGLDKMDVPAVKAKLTAVGSGGRDIEFMVDGASKKLDVSSSRTKVTIKGEKAARDELKAGMECSIEVMGDSKDANGVACN